MTADPEAGGSTGFTGEEQAALQLAAELSDRARRGRETVRRLKAYIEMPAGPGPGSAAVHK